MIPLDVGALSIGPWHPATEQRAMPSPPTPAPQIKVTPNWKSGVREKFAKAASLPPGWNGPSSVALEKDRLHFAQNIVLMALEDITDPALPFVVPMSDGGVQVEWHRAGADMEIAFFASGEISALFADQRVGSEVETEGVAAIDLLLRHARRVAETRSNATDVSVPAAATFIGLAA